MPRSRSSSESSSDSEGQRRRHYATPDSRRGRELQRYTADSWSPERISVRGGGEPIRERLIEVPVHVPIDVPIPVEGVHRVEHEVKEIPYDLEVQVVVEEPIYKNFVQRSGRSYWVRLTVITHRKNEQGLSIKRIN